MNSVAALAVALWSSGAQAREADPVKEYLGLTEATLKNPITERDLRDAVLSAAGVATITALFEKSIAESLTVGGEIVTPELGGEATLAEGRLSLVDYPDLTHAVIRRLLPLKDDPAAMLDCLNASPEGQRVLKTTGGLDALLYRLTRAPGGATPELRRLMDQVLLTAVSIHFKTWSVDPETQLEMIRKHEWRGRYVGFWHTHPPRVAGSDLQRGIEPSHTDLMNAVERGQFVTIVFQPDGFDFYDLSDVAEAEPSARAQGERKRVPERAEPSAHQSLGVGPQRLGEKMWGPTNQWKEPNLARARKIPYRSPQWEPAFRDLIRKRAQAANAHSPE